MIVAMRKEYGFGLHPDLLQVWYGDPDRFVTTVALRNERLMAVGGDRQTIVVIPPFDFYDPKSFDAYARSLYSTLDNARPRFFVGKCDILKKRLHGFLRDDPAIMAIGGLFHTLLGHCAWMDSNQEAAFTIEDF